ncbi:MAG: 2-amino-4-hydroxy-6-hydroxymethyldihydropteridine diphosphokinase [Muribaculaceae bacterium]|nr:2-amino-4-hydroxy-6-hydroxymethyldihydropteridine diphosphokinase [Muribaculaceae bacterium]
MIAHINIGSNLGRRAELISRAVSLLDPLVGSVLAVSQPVETEAEGFSSENLFLNVGVNVETTLAPKEIISRLQQIERMVDADVCHRTAAGNYCDRTIDLDLICLGNLVCSSPEATLPHPRMARRRFVLVPMAEILPGWTHPQLKLTPQQLLS